MRDTLTPFTPMKLLRHSDKVEAMLRGDVVYPIGVEIDLSNRCNHHCPWCNSQSTTVPGSRSEEPAKLIACLTNSGS